MIDELNKIPLTGTVDPTTLQQILENIHQNAVGVQYSTAVPTKIADGKVVVYQNTAGTDQRIYYKTTSSTGGSVAYASGTYVAPTVLIVTNRTADPSSPVAGEMWFRTDL